MLKYLGIKGNAVFATYFQIFQKIIIKYVNTHTHTYIYGERECSIM